MTWPRFYHRVWRSDTAMTWAALLTRVGGGLLLMFAVIRVLPPETAAVWLLFRVVLGLRILVESGLGATLSRVIAYAMGGADEIGDLRGKVHVPAVGGANWALVDRIWSSTQRTYLAGALITLGVLLLVATPLLIRPMAQLPSPTEGWWAWVVMAVSMAVVFWGASFVAYLLGVGRVALVRGWEAVVRSAALVFALATLWMGGGLFELVLVMQLFEVALVATNALLVAGVRVPVQTAANTAGASGDIVRVVLPRAWRNALGVSLIAGVNQLSGLVLAQWFTGATLASYLVAYRMFDAVNMFSMAPFYSKIPLLARLNAAGRRPEQVALARQRMFVSLSAYALGAACLGGLGGIAFRYLGVSIDFADPLLGALLMMGFFAERVGAMHLQFYTTTNHEVGHIMNGGYAILFSAFVLVLVRPMGIYGVPAAMIAAHLGFPLWYSTYLTRTEFGLGWSTFHRSVLVLPTLLLVIGILAMVVIERFI